MISVNDRESIRRAYFVEHKSIREIAKEKGHSRKTVRKALESAEPGQYTLQEQRISPVLGTYKESIDQLLIKNQSMPRKQHYTTHKIYNELHGAGYQGSESGVRGYIAQKRREKKRPQCYIPLEFDLGMDAQVDWGEAMVYMGGKLVTVQVFVMRLNYSRRSFVMAFPAQKQEAFFEGHVSGFHFNMGIPHRIAYDNLKTAVQEILQGHTRREQEKFTIFRSHYLFESYFCTPGQGHEKGGVEHEVGFSRRNFMVPIPEVATYEELNAYLLACCQADDLRQVDGQPVTIGQAWEMEKSYLMPLPERDFECCLNKPVTLNPYSQVEFETNVYSVPADKTYRNLVLKAYPLRVEILYGNAILAKHPRCYAKNQEICDPLHYLPLIEERPGAFENAKPIRLWRKQWPPIYEQLLASLRAENEGKGTREFVRVLKLHQDYPAEVVEQAVRQAMQFGCIHAEGVKLCLHQILNPIVPTPPLSITGKTSVFQMDYQPLDLRRYEQLLKG
jgi:transposase